MTTFMTRLALIATLLPATMLAVTGCGRDPERREIQFMPDMYASPAVKPQEASTFFRDGFGSRMPVAGTVSRTFDPYPYTILEGEKAGKELVNPVPVSAEVLETGRKYYNIHCKVCHGVVGSGDGMVTLVHRPLGMPIPPQLYTEKIRNEWSDGLIYHTISMGQGQMPGYASRITRENRWAIVHYVRALGIAANPTEEDLKAVEGLKWNAEELDNPYRPGADHPQLYLDASAKK